MERLINLCKEWPAIATTAPHKHGEIVAVIHSCLYELRQVAPAIALFRHNPGGWTSTFSRICSGPLEVDDESARSSDARNAQFELVMGSILHFAGVDVVPGEPDLICRLAPVTFGVACKRVQGPPGVERAFKDALRQIRRSGLYGFAAVDLTCAFFDEKQNRVEDDADPAAEESLSAVLPSVDDLVRASVWDGDRSCFGAIGYLTARTLSHRVPSISTWSGTRLVPRRPERDQSMVWIRQLCDRLAQQVHAVDEYLAGLAGLAVETMPTGQRAVTSERNPREHAGRANRTSV